ncbi:hypothetical protein [Streptomyces sp. NPDC002671]
MPCPHLGSVAALGVQTLWIPFSVLHGLRRKRRVEVAGGATGHPDTE